MRLLGVGMASTLSGSFLVTKAKATHLDIGKLAALVFECVPDYLHEPDCLEQELCDARNMLRAHEGISEGPNAQIIGQNMTMGKLKQALFEKEAGKKSDCTVLFPGGKGRHLTSDEVIAQKRALENAKAKGAADKAEWKCMLEEHAMAVDKWAGQCLHLKADGTKDKDLPKKPIRPLKPKPRQSDEEDNESDDGSDVDGE
ncbi:hypothetical protein K438DRAFT_1922544 [Mycena galopus ATCC 62051]|nr:hypothetical protein K438DRAFT_1922544 [Mycena galopus ATCC 62051]